MSQKYVPLHCHTDNSLLDGFQTVKEYVAFCKKNGFRAAAITDHGTCAGHEIFDSECRREDVGIKPILGMEGYLVDDVENIMTDRVAHTRTGAIKYNKTTGEPEREKAQAKDFNHGCLWAKNSKGLSNLWILSTLANTKGFYRKPRIDMAMLKEYHEGLFVSDGCMLSAVSRAIVAGDMEKAYEWENKLIDAVGKENVLVEIHTWQFCNPKTEDQLKMNADMKATNLGKIEIARKLGLRMIAVNDAHYNAKEDYVWHELEWSTTTGKGGDIEGDKIEGRGQTADWVMTDDEIRYWLGKHEVPKDVIEECIDNTGWVADHCNAPLDRGMKPPRFKSTREEDEKLFDKTVVAGFKELVPLKKADEYMDRLAMEVKLIRKCDLCGYFNTVADYANFVRAEDPDGKIYGVPGKHQSLLGPGRGSGGGSLVCYLMHITNLDPIKYGLYFERFLTAGRVISKVHYELEDDEGKAYEKSYEPSDYVDVEDEDGTHSVSSWELLDEVGAKVDGGTITGTRFDFRDCPDIDLDFEMSVVPYLHQYLRKQYGEWNFCHIGNKSVMKISQAFKDVAKVFGIEPSERQRIVNNIKATGWPMTDELSKYKYEDFVNCISKDPELKKMAEESDIFRQMWMWGGRFRSDGVHASGYVISKGSILGKMPLRWSSKEKMLVTEFDHISVAKMGFIKFDILKLSSLDTIREVYEKTHGTMDIADIYRMMRNEKLYDHQSIWKPSWNGDTIGIFQMDTNLGTTTAINARIKSFRDASMMTAVDRPGMTRSGLINDFYKVRQGKEPVRTVHPMIDPILAETSGFVVYQEQIMFIYSKIGSLTLEQADNIRKVFSKKITGEVPKMKRLLYDICHKNKEFMSEIPSKYATPDDCIDDIWLSLSRTAEYSFNKAHSVAYGMITSLESYMKKRYLPQFIVASLNTNPGKIEFLNYAKVHGLKVATPNVNKSGLEYVYDDGTIYMPLTSVAKVGQKAVDEIIQNAPYKSFDDYIERTSGRGGHKSDVVKNLISIGAFDGVDDADRFDLMVDWCNRHGDPVPKRNTWKIPRIRGKIEEQLLGVSLSYDPVFDHKDWLNAQGPQDIGRLMETEVGGWVTIAGEVVDIRRHEAKNGEMAWFTVRFVSHEEVSVTMFANRYSAYRNLISNQDVVAFRCRRDKDFRDKPSFVANDAINYTLKNEK